MNSNDKAQALEAIRLNIARHGHHIYSVSGGATPRWAYTVGLHKIIGFELILAGASFFSHKEVLGIINESAKRIIANRAYQGCSFIINSHGAFSFKSVDHSWARRLILGAIDYYGDTDVKAVQIVPDGSRLTIDVPDLSRPWTEGSEPVWQWLYLPWDKKFDENCMVVTDLQALQGARITEATRWESDQWEMFSYAGPDVPEEEARLVRLATLLAVDHSLHAVLDLKIGEGIWRDEEHGWQKWVKSDN